MSPGARSTQPTWVPASLSWGAASKGPSLGAAQWPALSAAPGHTNHGSEQSSLLPPPPTSTPPPPQQKIIIFHVSLLQPRQLAGHPQAEMSGAAQHRCRPQPPAPPGSPCKPQPGGHRAASQIGEREVFKTLWLRSRGTQAASNLTLTCTLARSVFQMTETQPRGSSPGCTQQWSCHQYRSSPEG